MADEVAPLTASAVGVHHTATDDGPWSASTNVSRIKDDATATTLADVFAWKPDNADDAKSKSNWKFPHHLVGADGKPGAANLRACSAVIAALNGGRGGRPDTPAAQRQGVYGHVRAHLVDGGRKPDDIPKLMAAELVEAMAAAHPPMVGTHMHPHSAYGSQGGDATHEHEHSHSGDNRHDHHDEMAVTTAASDGLPFGPMSFAASSGGPGGALVADGCDTVGDAVRQMSARWGVERTDTGWRVLTAAGVPWDGPEAESYQAAVASVAEHMATEPKSGVLPQRWRSEMAYEGVSTGDGRRIQPGAIGFRDTPLPLMLQTVTAGGHDGAVLAGTIEQVGMVGATAVGQGTFDDSPAGRQFVDLISARRRFGVSIDVAEADGELECTGQDADGECTDYEAVFSMIKIMGLTGCPFPAFADAHIVLDDQGQAQPVAASSNANAVTVTWNALPPYQAANGMFPTVTGEPCDECHESQLPALDLPLVAAGGPGTPPRDWFDDPKFEVGDGRVVRQPDGSYLCPLTVTEDGRVYGHMAGWSTCHTAYNVCITPPRSRTGYAAFLRGTLMTDDGSLVRVGQMSMGCGHAAEAGMSVDAVRAHYDGGPGAVQMADVTCGEDAFGVWFAGSLRPGVTDGQVARFRACALSGDWREVWSGKGLDLVACLAGVTSPGFPVAALAAAGLEPVADTIGGPKVRFHDGRPVALLAAGVVRQPYPWERANAHLQDQIDRLTARLERTERVASQLRPLAAQRLAAGLATERG